MGIADNASWHQIWRNTRIVASLCMHTQIRISKSKSGAIIVFIPSCSALFSPHAGSDRTKNILWDKFASGESLHGTFRHFVCVHFGDREFGPRDLLCDFQNVQLGDKEVVNVHHLVHTLGGIS
ncbi:hypothetical protein FRC14_007394 [Serendipita sp. 396]|nr:hypothetical protein FRC14_007394 [Serendipita sp. 396]KAG8777457.1 hypothetical protein FRC15_011331 [Serendipita sp. 397]KAG8794338.1 hypothetical protein FRC16_010571 [Serendipita sp. 398]